MPILGCPELSGRCLLQRRLNVLTAESRDGWEGGFSPGLCLIGKQKDWFLVLLGGIGGDQPPSPPDLSRVAREENHQHSYKSTLNG